MSNISVNQEWHFRILSIVWMLFSVWAIILQIFLQDRIVKITSWNLSDGWQREIGLWECWSGYFDCNASCPKHFSNSDPRPDTFSMVGPFWN